MEIDISSEFEMNESSKSVFRYDINALRTIAVTLVVLYHFRVPGFSSGFIGVDIFFVVSGYLMTRIIVDRINSNRFSVWRFYGDRARRIVPALTIVAFSVLVFGLLFLDSMTLATIGRHVFSSITFWSNMDYMRAGGYFDSTSESKWLLHTWSLSVEWQFYLVYPIVIVLMGRFLDLNRWLLLTLVVGAIISFALCVSMAFSRPTMAFYLLPTRAWEMLIGGIVAASEGRRSLSGLQRNLLSWLGLASVLGSNFVVDVNFWPSCATLLPTIGTALVIFAKTSDAKWTRNSAVVSLGKWSYSIYLWHWPPIAALFYYEVPLTLPLVAITIFCVVIFSAFSYRYFEQWPHAQFARAGQKRQYLMLGASTAIVAGFSALTFIQNGWAPYRAGAATFSVLKAASEDWNAPPNCGLYIPPCQIGDGNDSGVAVWGDSHAAQWYQRALVDKPSSSDRIVFFTQFGCPPLPGINKLGQPACSRKFDELFEQIKRRSFKRLIITASWPEYLPAFPSDGKIPVCFETASGCESPATAKDYNDGVGIAFRELGTKLQSLPSSMEIVFLLDTPTPNFNVPLAMAKQAFNPSAFNEVYADLKRSLVDKQNAFANKFVSDLGRSIKAIVLDPLTFVCNDRVCPVQDEGKPRYFDSSHITASAIISNNYSFIDPYLFSPKQ